MWVRGLGLLGLLGCEPLQSHRQGPVEATPVSGQDALVVSPAHLNFGRVEVADGPPEPLTFTATNAGTETIAVYGHDEVVGLGRADVTGVFTVDAEPVFELRPGAAATFEVAFSPPTDGVWDAELRINHGLEVVSVTGVGAAPVASLTAEGSSAAAFGCSDTLDVVFENTGTLPLTVSSLALDHPDFWVVTDPTPVTLASGQTMPVQVEFSPQWTGIGGGERSATLSARTTDPASPVVSVPVTGLAFEGAQVEQAFEYHPGVDVDLVVVADTDGVMELHMDGVIAALPDLIEALVQGRTTLHAVGLTGADACPTTTPGWLDEAASPMALVDTLADALSGPPGPGSDRLVMHAVDALMQREEGGCMADFLRPGAQLHVVVIAGRPDGSGELAESQLSAISDVAGLASDIIVSAVTPTDGVGCAGADYGAGYADLAYESGGAIVDLCLDDLGPDFESKLAAASLATAEGELSYHLDPAPLLESIEVTVEGRVLEGWTWDPETSELVLPADGGIVPGEVVTVRYVAAVPC